MNNFSGSVLPLPSWWMGKDAEEIGNLLVANALKIITEAHGEEYARTWLKSFSDTVQSQAITQDVINRLFK
ncbi:hypothetical protein [Marinobacter sp. P4B1]|uniref:hypothetical protein n=1 Tax=Marinobacter sp. P4B1 TaxID=1119533 RepID=UPI00071C5690|nr:hypothetical protein [Marinobacter sp. P4B1]KRW82677.1 hypothetical protein AQ621_10580 [Marinobacter sp. P4B1]